MRVSSFLQLDHDQREGSIASATTRKATTVQVLPAQRLRPPPGESVRQTVFTPGIASGLKDEGGLPETQEEIEASPTQRRAL